MSQAFLRAEVAKNTDFALVLARSLPRVRIAQARVSAGGGQGLSTVALRLQNTGFLRTSATTRAVDCSAVPPSIVVTAECSAGTDGEGEQKYRNRKRSPRSPPPSHTAPRIAPDKNRS